MKKLFVIVLLLFLVGCGNISNNDGINKDDFMSDVVITKIERCSVDWDQIQFSINLDENVLEEIKPIETNQTAIEVGTKIIEKLHEKGDFSEYVLLSIVYSTEDNVWQFEYSLDQRNVDNKELIDCGGLYVAIDGNKGTLIKAWLME